MKDKNQLIAALADYAVEKNLLSPEDRTYAVNKLLSRLDETEYEEPESYEKRPLEEILRDLCDYAYEKGILTENSVAYRDLFDTSLMGELTPRPSEVIGKFEMLMKKDKQAATDYFYSLSRDCDYIRTYRVAKDLKWTYDSPYGTLDITVNLSKPEKDPKAIAAAKSMPQSGYPKCLLCHENEGYRGTLRCPARQNLRQIPLTLGGNLWYMQYSPYVYYNEHCIVLSSEHTPMKITENTFRRALDFVEVLPHYFIGSNADLPIVGGSILTHDHMQGGRYTFAMERAEITEPLTFRGFEQVKAGIVKWPMSVIRLNAAEKEPLVALAAKILAAWRGYTDEKSFVFAETDGEKHSTITPIARRRGDLFELDLVLRNNITTKEYPDGVYHPHPELHHIKKENIGLIEVMGLAVLPARLKDEMASLAEAMLKGSDISADEKLAKHADWAKDIAGRYTLTRENIDGILKKEIGAVFTKVLENAGVYPPTEEGRRGIRRFVDAVNAD
ncbi:MAG: UDP-glucose--hexose-1-phosphate uridylyltransferase [Clostridia bacterium]|nr:UDP-glucose--hexose-1-phosphate uridylyltransferase [Clostridia bacterium]